MSHARWDPEWVYKYLIHCADWDILRDQTEKAKPMVDPGACEVGVTLTADCQELRHSA